MLVASTCVIGMQLPIDRIAKGVEAMAGELSSSLEAGTAAAQAIMTTDTVKKEIAVQIEIGGKTVTIGGMCKGSGMIHPNMCTMLSFVTTDADITCLLYTSPLARREMGAFSWLSLWETKACTCKILQVLQVSS